MKQAASKALNKDRQAIYLPQEEEDTRQDLLLPDSSGRDIREDQQATTNKLGETLTR